MSPVSIQLQQLSCVGLCQPSSAPLDAADWRQSPAERISAPTDESIRRRAAMQSQSTRASSRSTTS